MFKEGQSAVKKWTAAGIFSLAVLAADAQAQSWHSGRTVIRSDSVFTIFSSVVDHVNNKLTEEVTSAHEAAFWHAVNNAENGQVTKWDTGNHNGLVVVIMTMPSNDGYCRRVESLIVQSGKSSSFLDTVCYSDTARSWTFWNKY
jgi:hypothetical protein